MTDTYQDFCGTSSYEPTPSPTYDYGELPTIDYEPWAPTWDDTLILHSHDAKSSKNETSTGENDPASPANKAKNQTSTVHDRKPQPKVAKDQASDGDSRKAKRI
jgi:hypothetical protein